MTEALLDCPGKDERILFARQPIFDSDKNIWGYELTPHDSAEGADSIPLDGVVAAFLDNLTAFGLNDSAAQRLFLTINDDRHFNGLAEADWLDRCVVAVTGQAARSSALSGFIDLVQARNSRLAIDEDAGAEAVKGMSSRFDFIKVSLEGKSPAALMALRHKLMTFPGKLVAMNIPTWEAYEGSRALGFKYFHGPFFASPRTSDKDAGLRASAVPKLQLLRELSAPSCEIDDLASIIASDVSLSYRILRYINSPAFGMRNEIKSIQQAISLLGLKELRHWARVVVMTDLDSTPRGEELAYMALQRARFMSGLSLSLDSCRHSSETLFMLGLFSKLDALLSYPMEKALEDIPMDSNIKEGLCGRDNEYGSCLRMLSAVEQADWDAANLILKQYGISVAKAAIEYMRASKWAAQQLPSMRS